MASLREIMPYILGGAAGALSPRGADAVQTAAAWSNRLKQQDIENERRDQIAGQTARRLELAEAGEVRAQKDEVRRTSKFQRDQERQAKSDKLFDEQRELVGSAREAMSENAVGIAKTKGWDEGTLFAYQQAIGAAQSLPELTSARKAFGVSKTSIKEADARYADQAANVGTGETVTSYAGGTQRTARGASHPTSASQSSQRSLGPVIEGLGIKHQEIIAEAEDDLAEAQRAVEDYRALGGTAEDDPEFAKLDRAVRTMERKLATKTAGYKNAVRSAMVKAGRSDEDIAAMFAEPEAQDSDSAAIAAALANQGIVEEQATQPGNQPGRFDGTIAGKAFEVIRGAFGGGLSPRQLESDRLN